MKEEYIKICKLSDIKEKSGKRFLINDVDVAVFRIKGEVFVLDNICPHQHSAVIYEGFVEEGYVACPAHGWLFNLKTGRQPTGAKGLNSYPVKIINDEVYAILNAKEFKW